MWFLALIPEIFDALTAFIAAGGWWQIPVFVGLWKVEETATSPPPAVPPAQQSPVQRAVGGAGAAIGGTTNAIGGFGDFIAGDGKWVVIGLGAMVIVLGRR